MSGYPHQPAGYGYGPPPSQQTQPYGSAPPYSSPYGAPQQPSAPYGTAPQAAAPYGAAQPAAPYGSPYGAPAPGTKPPKDKPHASAPSVPGGYPPAPYGSPFSALLPSTFPPGTDPSIIACFQLADQDGSGLIDDNELQRALSSYNQSFSLRTVRLLMYLFTNTNTRKIAECYCIFLMAQGIQSAVLQFAELEGKLLEILNWKAIFERFDRDRSGKIDCNELREALLSLGFSVSPVVLDLLVSKFDKTGGKNKAIEYDNFIECCLTVKGLTEKFKERDTGYSGSASFTYENFMLTVLPFLIA
ncbi:unnamed protein product [Dovyalis caffra]|uniref:EF-hand domain-containing protein n=1 Tax=Dovyalis caffra TaxID=77055 RepID=A0AAV1RYQ7_9ROSI|nr:unnamed protein product [Dovyalis caffra]